MEEAIGWLTVLYGVALGLLYRIIMSNISAKVGYFDEELDKMEEGIAEISQQLIDSLSQIENGVKEMPSPLEAMELMRANMMNQVLGMGVQFIGKKFGIDMGVHQIEAPENEIDPPL